MPDLHSLFHSLLHVISFAVGWRHALWSQWPFILYIHRLTQYDENELTFMPGHAWPRHGGTLPPRTPTPFLLTYCNSLDHDSLAICMALATCTCGPQRLETSGTGNGYFCAAIVLLIHHISVYYTSATSVFITHRSQLRPGEN